MTAKISLSSSLLILSRVLRYLWKRVLCFLNFLISFVRKGQSSHWYLYVGLWVVRCFEIIFLKGVLKSHFGHWYLLMFRLLMFWSKLCTTVLCKERLELSENVILHNSQGTRFLWIVISCLPSFFSVLKVASQEEHLKLNVYWSFILFHLFTFLLQFSELGQMSESLKSWSRLWDYGDVWVLDGFIVDDV